MRACGVALATLVLAGAVAAPVMAQAGPAAGRWELGGGGVLVGGYSLGESVAELTPNSGSAPSFEQFTTDNRVRQAFGVQARIGFMVNSALVVEGGLRFTRPVFDVRVSGDAEGAADTSAEETLSQYLFDGSVRLALRRARRLPAGARCRSCTAAPATCASCTSRTRWSKKGWSTTPAAASSGGSGGRRRFGVRGDAGISIRDGGFDFEDSRRVVPIVAGSLVYTF